MDRRTFLGEPLPEELARNAIAHEEAVGDDKVRMTFRVVLSRPQAEALAARAIREEKNPAWSTGGRTMKHSSIVFLLLFAAIVSTAPAEGQDEKAAVTQALNDYASAFHTFDVQRVQRYYHEPLMLVGRRESE